MTLKEQMDPELFSMVLDTLAKLEREKLQLETKLDLDREGTFPEELIRFMLGPEIGLHLIFIPEEYGGLGAGAAQIAVISEEMAKIDLAVATSFLAICLGMDPIRVGATPEQKEKYVRKVAEAGLVVAYGVTEPDAGSNVQSLKTKAERVVDDSGNVVGYKINGRKQFITNGGVADLYTILADTPDGPSFFIVEKGAEGLIPGSHEDKHGIRASDTCPLTIEDLYVPAENLVGLVEGQGLKQANEVFGYTRLMVATFGLGGGVAAFERAVKYSKERVQFGTTLIEKEGYTHRLLVPHAVRLEGARAYIEHVAKRLDGEDVDLQVEGSIAKYFATEAGDAAANDAIQAFGGYGYIREYEVEKIKRDVKILTIYEGTSEIQLSIISLFRMRETVRSKGGYYEGLASQLADVPDECGADLLARALRVINSMVLGIRKAKLTKSQYVMFLLGDMITWCEVAHSLCLKAAGGRAAGGRPPEFLKASARLLAREAVEKVYGNALKIIHGSEGGSAIDVAVLEPLCLDKALSGMFSDMHVIAEELRR
jgi:alkylation response protein AidB-like acyl-CoA dehydrogenase